MTRTLSLVGGIVSSVLYVAMTAGIALQWKDYSSASQTISELSAIGAPTRSVWVAFGALYTLLVTGFGWGVWQVSRTIPGAPRRRRRDPGLRRARPPLAVCPDAPS